MLVLRKILHLHYLVALTTSTRVTHTLYHCRTTAKATTCPTHTSASAPASQASERSSAATLHDVSAGSAEAGLFFSLR